jgi:hypothetical protein
MKTFNYIAHRRTSIELTVNNSKDITIKAIGIGKEFKSNGNFTYDYLTTLPTA